MTVAKPRQIRQLRMDFDHVPVDHEAIDALVSEMTEVYLRDDGRPWVIGFSGGKDSTCVVQLTYRMLMALPAEKRTKPVYVISSDTLVENPKVAAWLDKCHAELRQVAADSNLPVTVVKVYPKPTDSFWVCLIGKGYPAPTQDFRWCTGRLKIAPSEAYVLEHIDPDGRILQLLGSRIKESKARQRSIEAHALDGKFGKAGSLAEAITYQPIQHLDNDNVWEMLRGFPAPWPRDNDAVQITNLLTGEVDTHYNNELFALYQDAHAGECVMEWDRRTASCGGSRFGCWTCTVVPEDKSMTNMVQVVNPEFAPLLAFRQKILDYRHDSSKRNPIGRNGRIRLNSGARLTEAKAYAEVKGDERLTEAWTLGARWAEAAFYKHPGVSRIDAAEYHEAETGLDGAAAAFEAGAGWAQETLLDGTESKHATPGPYLFEVRAELLEDLFRIEQQLPGFKTLTDDDLRLIRAQWEKDGFDPTVLDGFVQTYRGGVTKHAAV